MCEEKMMAKSADRRTADFPGPPAFADVQRARHVAKTPSMIDQMDWL
jgi:hypothetical protein